MAFANPNITAYAVEATEFPDLARRYRVTGVPKTVVNETDRDSRRPAPGRLHPAGACELNSRKNRGAATASRRDNVLRVRSQRSATSGRSARRARPQQPEREPERRPGGERDPFGAREAAGHRRHDLHQDDRDADARSRPTPSSADSLRRSRRRGARRDRRRRPTASRRRPRAIRPR